MIFPSFEQFCRWSNNYSVIPFFCDFVFKEKDFHPRALSLIKNLDPTFFLGNGAENRPFEDCPVPNENQGEGRRIPNARYFFFPLSLPAQIFKADKQKAFPNAWKKLQSYFKFYRGPSLQRNLPPFYGGAVGILSYDCGRFFEKGWRTLSPPDPLKLPSMDLGVYNEVACFDSKMARAFLFSCFLTRGQKMNRKKQKEIYREHKRKLLQLADNFNCSKNNETSSQHGLSGSGYTDSNRDWFVKSVKKIKEYIAAGDIYQANLSQRIGLKFKGSGMEFFKCLCKINPSPYSCFFRFPNYEIVSCSPELLLKKRGKMLETRPLAGTRPRGRNVSSDEQLEGELLLSEKECAEHIMLLDLERNDLGRVCEPASVKVREKMTVEKYSHVMHIVSHVQGRIKNGEDIFSAVAAVFPGGTITGCPKVRCMEILDEIEPVARGPFFGSAGWIGYQGDAEMNLLIRSAAIKNHSEVESSKLKVKDRKSELKKIYIQAGSGIVADSVPEFEYKESLHKAAALLEVLKKKSKPR